MKLHGDAIISFITIRNGLDEVITYPITMDWRGNVDHFTLTDTDECIGIVPAPHGAFVVRDENDVVLGYTFDGADHPESAAQWEQATASRKEKQ